jgi:hypothetical protein
VSISSAAKEQDDLRAATPSVSKVPGCIRAEIIAYEDCVAEADARSANSGSKARIVQGATATTSTSPSVVDDAAEPLPKPA